MAGKLIEDRLRPLITCSICKEYMVEPTMLAECFHNFCFICIEKHLDSCKRGKGTCPDCGVKKKYDRDIDRPSHRKMVRDTVLEEIIKSTFSEEAAQPFIDDWYTKRKLKLPIRPDHLTSEQKSLSTPYSSEKLSIRLNGAEDAKFESPNMLVCPNSTINALRKAISTELKGDESIFEKIILSVNGKELEDDLTMFAIFVHYFKYQAVPMPFDLKIEV